MRTLAVVLSLASVVSAQTPPSKPLHGFADAAAERALEARFDAAVRADDIRGWVERLSARPHHLGSPGDRENVEFLAAQFRAWGFDTRVEEFDVLFPTPRERVLELVAPEKYTARLEEPVVDGDPTTGQKAEQLPTYNCYSIDGDVTAELVYVNYGVPADYDALAEQGVDVKGKIVIARYGGSWRGIKPKVAAERGAVGCLIYSDPRDDGYAQGDTYPAGPWRGEHGVQRGSVVDMPLYPGDPLTPGYGSTKDAKRLAIADVKVLTKIPVMPISYADALPLLRALGGPVAPQAMRGALPIPYHMGPGPARVHFKLAFDWNTATARNVIATLKGSAEPDAWVIRGNHHDAWVNGADDPVSGLAALMAEAKAVGALAKDGWRPRRSIVYCAWGGEEQGLLGSTEWAETHADELRRKAVAYVNSDSNGRGFLNMGGSHALERLMNEVAADVVDPQRKTSVGDRDRARVIAVGEASEKAEVRAGRHLRLDALGSGSDYSPFLQHLGIASLNLGYGGEGRGGSYHSIYDSFAHYSKFIDPKFEYGVALAQTAGRAVLRLANAEVLPFELAAVGETIGGYADELEKLNDRLRTEAEERNKQLDSGALVAASDPTKTYVPPPRLDVPPKLDFGPLKKSIERVKAAAKAYDAGAASRAASPEAARRANAMLAALERALTRPEGLPGRPWYVHHVYAPGFYTGYGVKTLPGVREALEQRQWQQATEQLGVLAGLLDGYAAAVEAAAK